MASVGDLLPIQRDSLEGVCNAMREKFDGPTTAFSVFCHRHTFRTITEWMINIAMLKLGNMVLQRRNRTKNPPTTDLPELQTVLTAIKSRRVVEKLPETNKKMAINEVEKRAKIVNILMH